MTSLASDAEQVENVQEVHRSPVHVLKSVLNTPRLSCDEEELIRILIGKSRTLILYWTNETIYIVPTQPNGSFVYVLV